MEGTIPALVADAQGGKWTARSPRSARMACSWWTNMTATPEWTAEQHTKQDGVRQAFLTSPLLTSIELDHGSGVILATRHA